MSVVFDWILMKLGYFNNIFPKLGNFTLLA